MVAWGLLTLGTGFCDQPWQIMVIRFFQAIFEASTFVGCQYILGSWYKEEELGKRTAIFTSSGLAGTMFSGFLQGSIHSSLGLSFLSLLHSHVVTRLTTWAPRWCAWSFRVAMALRR
jgi:MFS family permease